MVVWITRVVGEEIYYCLNCGRPVWQDRNTKPVWMSASGWKALLSREPRDRELKIKRHRTFHHPGERIKRITSRSKRPPEAWRTLGKTVDISSKKQKN